MIEQPPQITCEICGGGHPTEAHPKNSETSKIRVGEGLGKKQVEKEPSDFERVTSQIENSPLIGSALSDKIQIERLRQIMNFGLPLDARSGDISVACDNELLRQIKEKVQTDDSEVLERYGKSSEQEPLNFQDRQAVVNIILNPTHRIYKDESGTDVNLSEYLKNYYAPLGVDVSIGFNILTPTQSRAVDRFFRITGTNFSGQHLENESIAIPFVQLKKGEKSISIPIIGGDRDIHAPMRDPDTRERIGSFVGLKIVHEPQLGSGLAANTGSMVHELDHAIRKIIDGDEMKFDAEDRIVLEGTAEFARHHFSEIQNQYNPNIGYGLNNALTLAGGIEAEGTEIKPGLKHTYASGLILSERVEQALGREKFFESGYNFEKTFSEGDLTRLRQQITNKLEESKNTARKFMIDF